MEGKRVNHAFSVQLDGVYRKDGEGVNTFLQIVKLQKEQDQEGKTGWNILIQVDDNIS